MRVGLIGYGYWGPNLARNFHRYPGCTLARVVDMEQKRRDAAQRDCPGVEVAGDPSAVTKAADIDAVVIATPIWTHYELAMEALQNGKHVLVEKPMTDSVATSQKLVEEAEKRKLVLMVDHIFVYTETVRWMREFVKADKLGELYYFDSVRANLGLFQHSANVIWDLAPHDLSILWDITGRKVLNVSATGACHAGSRMQDIAYLSLDLGGGTIAHFHVNWLSPVKLRQTIVAGSKQMIIFDDMLTSEKIKVYDTGVEIAHNDAEGQRRMQVDYRAGDMMSPALAAKEALYTEVDHFVKCIENSQKPLSDGYAGLAVVEILEAAQKSMDLGGAQVATT